MSRYYSAMIARVFFVFLFAFLFAPVVSVAEESVFQKYFDNFPKSKEHSQKIIDYCWSISDELRSLPGLDSMTRGQHLTVECFENQYIKLFLIVNIRHDQKTEEELRKQFDDLRSVFLLEIYEDINNIRGAHNMAALSSSTSYTNLMQNILTDLIYQIHFEYNSNSPDVDIMKALKHLDSFTP